MPPHDDPDDLDFGPDDTQLHASEPDEPELGSSDPDEGELTARPSARAQSAFEDDDDRLVPSSNIGGAAPTIRGRDSGGDLPGPEDDLANLAEPEPPTAAEVDGLSVRGEDEIVPTMGRDDPQP
ncbi:MAG TPA: hypothetical protein VEB43_13555 [Anaeromyxobacter sp.]|nr:hypothetical protein [Anaeromyxobacter sp.]